MSTVRRLRRRGQYEQGYTLVEVVLCATLMAVVIVPLSMVLTTSLRVAPQTKDTTLADAQRTRLSMQFADDIANADPSYDPASMSMNQSRSDGHWSLIGTCTPNTTVDIVKLSEGLGTTSVWYWVTYGATNANGVPVQLYRGGASRTNGDLVYSAYCSSFPFTYIANYYPGSGSCAQTGDYHARRLQVSINLADTPGAASTSFTLEGVLRSTC